MSSPHDPFSFDVGYGDDDTIRAAADPNRPPSTGAEWKPNGRAADAEVVKGSGRTPIDDLDGDSGEPEANAGDPHSATDDDFEGVERASLGKAGATQAKSSFDNLPDIPAFRELKRTRKWVSWKYLEKTTSSGETYLTKPPVCPHDNRGAQVDKSWTWGDYDEAVQNSLRNNLAGVGYVLTADDDVSGFDLDGVRNSQTGELQDFAQAIVNLGETYTEVSPSGAGLRLFWRGNVNAAITHKPAQVEIYSSGRYLTVTGQQIAGTPDEILAAPKTLELLRARVDAFKAAEAKAKGEKKDEKNDTRCEQPGSADANPSTAKAEGSGFFKDVNTAALANLSSWVPAIFASAKYYPGTGAWRISSVDLGRNLEEDLSISPKGIKDWGVWDIGDARDGRRTAIDLVMEYGGAPDAVAAALWLCERMAIDPQTLGWEDDHDSGGWTFAGSAFDFNDAKPQEDEDKPADNQATGPPDPPSSDELPEALLNPPGLVGEIARYITDSAIYPQPALSLGAALTIMGTAAGRRLAGPTRSGTHLYIIGLAPSGGGKDHPRAMIGVILAEAGMAACIGPSEFISMPAVYKFLNRAPLSVCAMDEFGAFLERINSRKASGFEAQIGATLRTAWGSSFKPMPTPEWAGKDMGTIYAPALSIYGVSTPREFYASLAGADVTNGVLNRFLQIETKVRPAERMPIVDPTVVPASILAELKKIYVPGTNPASILHQETKVRDHKTLDITPEAEAIRKGLVKEIQAMGDADKTLEPFLARTAENAIRIATILAVGRNSTTVNAADMAWARAFTMWATHRMAEGAGLYIADSDNQAMANDVKRALKGNGKVSRSALIRALGHKYKAKELDGVLNLMIEAEEVTVERGASTSKGGQPPRWYTLQI